MDALRPEPDRLILGSAPAATLVARTALLPRAARWTSAAGA